MGVGIYKLTKSDDSVFVLFVPRFSGERDWPASNTMFTIASATAERADLFDHTATFFVSSSTVHDNMIAQGFTSVVNVLEHQGEVWSFENGGQFRFESNTVRYYFPNASNYWGFRSPGVASTFLSDVAMYDWMSGPVGYYGWIRAVTDTQFQLSPYYPINYASEETFNLIWDGNTPFGASTDPYTEGGESGTGGGTGDFDGTSDSIDIPGLPTLSAIGTGFVTLYTPTVAQLHNLANYMWNADVTTLDFWKKIVADPIDLILGLNIVPVESTIAGTKSVNVGFIDTGISMNYTNSQYVEVDCGSINVNEYWGAYLDYSPYTRAEIYLPYCGYHAIDADEIMGKTVTVKYHVDILSGACTAFVKCGQSVLYQFSGSCASAIPVTSSQYGDQVIAAATLAAQLAALPASPSAGALGGGMALGSYFGEATEDKPGAAGRASAEATAAGFGADAASTVTKMKPNIARSGAIGNMAGQLAIQTPYIILSRPRQCLPAYQNTYKGYPANITSTLGDLSGFTVVDSIHLENIPCTLDEQNEIDKFLKNGVII